MPLSHPFRQFAPGYPVHLPGRGTTFVRELQGPPGAPTLVLLHGWTATGGVNWDLAMEPLAEQFHVVTIDHRGHGRGIRSAQPFSLEACADDVAAMMEQLGIPNAIVAGYSMGGPIAQLLALRHPDRVAGLVMCSTAARFPQSVPVAIPLDVVSRVLKAVQHVSGRQVLPLANRDIFRSIPVVDELGRHDPRVITQCGPALARFDSTTWAHRIHVPSAAVLTTKDQLVAPALQRELSALLGAHNYMVRSPSGHFAAGVSQEWVTQLMVACRDVELRARGLSRGVITPTPQPRWGGQAEVA